MWRLGQQATPGSRRDRLAVLLAFATVVGLGSAFLFFKDTHFLMPGPLASAHGAIENCSACHTKSGSGKLSWIHGLVAGDPAADSKACLTCHKMPDTAFNAHGASAEALNESTKRLTKIAAETPAPQSAHAQSIAFPTHDVVARGLYCATCHQEHQGVNFNLNKISNEQCRSCHVVKFDSFDGHHPKFETYPFKRRTRIVYDHAGHFGKHYPEVAKKDPSRRIPETCSTCHNSRENKRIMAVAPFEQTCSACHLNQIVGKERASGPKGIAFLTLPGIDLQTLKKKKASIGEWPDASDAALTPFMKVMISRDERGRALIKTADSLNLQDLTNANDDQIKAVTKLIWEIKGVFHALIKGKASDVLGNLNIGGGAKLSASLVADLTASIPRDVVISAQQQWLPNLATEMANRPETSNSTSDQKQSGWNPVTTESIVSGSASHEEPSHSDARQTVPKLSPEAAGSKAQPERAAGESDTANTEPNDGKKARSTKELPPPMRAGLKFAENADEPGGATIKRLPLPSGTSRAIDAQSKDAEKSDDGKEARPADEPPRANKARIKDAEKPVQPEAAAEDPAPASTKAEDGKETPSSKSTDQSDDLLFPTEEELRAIKGGIKNTAKAAEPEGAAGKADTANAKPDGAASSDGASKADANAPADAPEKSDTAAAAPQTRAAPVISIESDVDPESWAEYGGWYRQDYAIFYRPTGHKDKFIYSWLYLTGPKAPIGDTSPAAAVFDVLTNKDAQGSCTKCHSVDDNQGKGRVVNFSPPSVKSKQGRFTSFIHEPHFGILENRGGRQENRGCLTCHELEKDRPYLKSYEQTNPQNFASNFGEVKKDLCQTCHNASMARQDCMLCHKYHVNDIITPIMNTKLRNVAP